MIKKEKWHISDQLAAPTSQCSFFLYFNSRSLEHFYNFFSVQYHNDKKPSPTHKKR
jgi:hypothetical protein